MPRYAVKRGESPAQAVGKTTEVYQVLFEHASTESDGLSHRKDEMPTFVLNRVLIEPE